MSRFCSKPVWPERAPGQAAKDAADNLRMKNLRPGTLGILERIEALSGRPVEFKPDSSLTLSTNP